uniref:Uncharacterized protein n=1 Tax=Anguilla anguilla TaxID=7936 RepID=A0A0E9W255_ANGAN
MTISQCFGNPENEFNLRYIPQVQCVMETKLNYKLT